MTALSLLRAGAAALALCAAIAPAAAQFVPAPTPTADALAAQMRQLGVNPRDVYALIAAGELSTKLGDPAAALGFFGRAQAIDPSNPRIAAGKAGALVLLERPGEALQLYAQAERDGVAMAPYLVQRGLAYDLIGQPGYAQRDYRRALLADRDDETVRRLALSLGISGRRDEAMALLDPLLRRSDRAAWRARACILAVSGDVAGAQRIAATMMNGGAALSPFFSRLQWLSPADRAFAVHFGEVGASAARANDARLAPALAVLPVEPQALPGAAPVVAAMEARARDSHLRRPGRTPTVIAAPAAPALEPPGPPPVQLAKRDPLPPAVFTGDALPQRSPIAPSIAMRAPTPAGTATASTLWAVTADTPRPDATIARSSEKPALEIVTLPQRRSPRPAATPAPPPARVETRTVSAPAPTPTPTPTPSPRAPAAEPDMPPQTAAPPPASAPTAVTPAPPAAVVRTPEVAQRNTGILASIIETITVPASELEVAPTPRRAPRKIAEAVPDTATTDAKKPDARKAESKKVDAKKADAKKAEAKKPDPAKLEPARWWVQVAGGANAADLAKDWRRLATKSPAAFRGKIGWTTPLRATNRLLAGPFKSQGDAAAFVNLLAKDGTSAFAWQSEAGQAIERLATK